MRFKGGSDFCRSRLRVPCLLALVILAGALTARAAEPMQSFKDCVFVPQSWADGDSFPVRFPDGKVRTVRLYGVDCLESQVQGNDSNARRLLDQRRWFGIADIQQAREMGERGKEETARLLAKPFTVHTAFADARGDSRYQRIYGFVTLSNRKDLAEHLVGAGLARAFGVYRERPDGVRADEWREHLKDLELQAAKRGAGAWALTDWESLPVQRRAARAEEAELIAAKGGPGSRTEPDKPLDPNEASRDELLSLPGIGETMALRIIEGRPYASLQDLLNVPGIGAKTLEKLEPHLLFTDDSP